MPDQVTNLVAQESNPSRTLLFFLAFGFPWMLVPVQMAHSLFQQLFLFVLVVRPLEAAHSLHTHTNQPPLTHFPFGDLLRAYALLYKNGCILLRTTRRGVMELAARVS